MKTIRTILCPVDFTLVSERELALAAQLGARFTAALVLQHNLSSGAGLGVSWMHEKTHGNAHRTEEHEARERMIGLLAALPENVRAHARGAITHGPLDHSVRTLAELAGADLIVIGTHGHDEPDHCSETERLITTASCPVLTTRDDASHTWLPALGDDSAGARIATLVPVDFSKHATRALRYALDLAGQLPLDVTALYVPDRIDHDVEWVETQLEQAAPGRRTSFQLNILHGNPADAILQEESAHQTRLVVMGAHAHGLLPRLLGRGATTSRTVLRESRCPVWFVPATAAV